MTEEFLVSRIAAVVFVALTSGILFNRLKQPDILGYVLTGVILGPSFCRLIPSCEQIEPLAQLGVLLLLFVTGLELDIQTFKRNLRVSTLSVLLQIAAGLVLSGLVSLLFYSLHWPLVFTVALGFTLALSSTAVVINTLEALNMKNTETGALTIGILIAQDIAVVPMILTIKTLSGGGSDWGLIAKVIASIAFMALFIAYLGSPHRTSRNFDPKEVLGANRDLYMLLSLSVCFAAAAIAGGLGLTAPYGAFLAGLTLGNLSERNELLVESIQPIQKILLMVFFLSIGLLLDLQFVKSHFWSVAFLLIIMTVVKTGMNIAVLQLLRIDIARASFVSVALAQLGEFAFLLTTALPGEPGSSFEVAKKYLIALTVLSLVFSPMWLRIAQKLRAMFEVDNLSIPRLAEYVFGKTLRTIQRHTHQAVVVVVRVSHSVQTQYYLYKKHRTQKGGHRPGRSPGDSTRPPPTSTDPILLEGPSAPESSKAPVESGEKKDGDVDEVPPSV